MAIGTVTRTNGGANIDPPGSLPVVSLLAIGDATDATTNALDPHTIDEAGFHWVEVPRGYGRCIPWLRTAVGITAMTTPPIVKLIGALGIPDDDGDMATDATFRRLDNASWANSGITLPFIGPSAGLANATYSMNDYPTVTPYDCLGFPFIGVAVVTAAASITGSGTSEIFLDFLN